jgi:transposase-like protein
LKTFVNLKIMKKQPRTHRTFSRAFKKEKVDLLDAGKITVKELSEIYEVSKVAIYKWKKKYSKLGRGERIVIEKISEEQKNIELLHRIKELEQIVGKKQIELDYYKTAINILSEEQGEDILKKYKPE